MKNKLLQTGLVGLLLISQPTFSQNENSKLTRKDILAESFETYIKTQNKKHSDYELIGEIYSCNLDYLIQRVNQRYPTAEKIVNYHQITKSSQGPDCNATVLIPKTK